MKNLQRHVRKVYTHCQNEDLDDERKKKLEAIVELKKKKEIDFEEFTRRVIGVYKNSLEVRSIKDNKVILNYIYNLLTVVNENRWFDKKYDEDIKPISREIKEKELEYGLKEDEYFPLSQDPEEIEVLRKKYELILDKKRKEVLNEFLPSNILKKFSFSLKTIEKEEQQGFEKIAAKKQKRRKSKAKEILLMDMYYQEFKQCYKNEVYIASVTMLGASFESLLLYIISNSSSESKLDVRIQGLYDQKVLVGKKKKLYEMGLSDLITLSSHIGLMPRISYKEAYLLLDQMSKSLQNSRNIIHPGKILKKNSKCIVPYFLKKDVDLLHSVFQIVKDIQGYE